MFVTLSGMTREVIPWQPQNDSSHMRVTELGMVILDNFSQLRNACRPIFVTELGIVTEVNSLHISNVAASMEVIELDNSTDFSPLQ